MPKKNLMELCLSPDLGGLELFMVRCAQGFKENFNVISVINENSKLEQYYRDGDDEFYCIKKSNNILMFRAAKKLARLIDEKKIDILHLHWTKDIPLCVLAKKLARRDVKLAQTRNMTMTKFKDDFYHRKLYANIDLMLPVTYQVKEQLEKFIPQAIRPVIEVVYMGTPEIDLLNDGAALELRLELGMQDKFAIGMVGRIEETKAQYLLIEAIDTLNARGVDAEAFFVGHEMEEGYIQTLMTKASQMGIEDKIHFLGFMKEPSHFYQICDTIVLATQKETFGLVLIEAMRAGTAIVGSDSGGVLEIIEDEKSGLLFKSLDAEDLSIKLGSLIIDPMKKSTLERFALERVEERFDAKKQFKKLEQVLERL